MDAITHACLAAAIVEARFREKLGGKAVLAGAVLAMLPDIDVVSALAGPWAMMKYHRGPTHSLILIALAAPALAWAARGLAKGRSEFRAWWILAFVALASNPVLDLFTSYGTQLFWPVTDRRFAIDAIAIIDPVYTLPLLAALVLACIPRIRGFSRGFAVWMLVATMAYLAYGFVQMTRARDLAFKDMALDGFVARDIRAVPLPLTFDLLWHVAARDADNNVCVGTVLLGKPRRVRLIRLDRPASPLIRKALDSDRGRLFAWFANGMVSAQVERDTPTPVVLLEDQRYGFVLNPAHSPFAAEAVFDAAGNLTEMRTVPGRRRVRFTEEFHAAWRLIRGK